MSAKSVAWLAAPFTVEEFPVPFDSNVSPHWPTGALWPKASTVPQVVRIRVAQTIFRKWILIQHVLSRGVYRYVKTESSGCIRAGGGLHREFTAGLAELATSSRRFMTEAPG
jgi:hypothetical protein